MNESCCLIPVPPACTVPALRFPDGSRPHRLQNMRDEEPRDATADNRLGVLGVTGPPRLPCPSRHSYLGIPRCRRHLPRRMGQAGRIKTINHTRAPRTCFGTVPSFSMRRAGRSCYRLLLFTASSRRVLSFPVLDARRTIDLPPLYLPRRVRCKAQSPCPFYVPVDARVGATSSL